MKRNVLRFAAIGIVVFAFSICAATAKAGLIGGNANCGPTTAVFSSFGDWHQYYFATNGGFEQGSTGWSLSGGPKIVAGNEPFYLHSPQDSHSLLMPSGASATTPWLCFGTNTPGFRFLAMSPTGSGTVHVRLVVRGLLGVLSILDGGTVQVGPTWAPTIDFGTTFSNLSQLLLSGNQFQIMISTTGSVQVDDMFVDPFVQY
jgi:hypothetical protein